MRNIYAFVIIIVWCIGFGIGGYLPSESFAIEAYFDTEISTSLEIEKDVGIVLVKMLDEEVPQIFPDITYERRIFVEIIFDASKTMGEPDLNGIAKIDIAKEIVSILVNYFPQRDTRFALRVNGGRYPNNCLDSELVVPFRRQNGQEVLDVVQSLQPTGLSPLTYSIRQILRDFEGTKGTKVVFVITDGMETCDIEPADPCTITMDMLLEAEFEGSLNIIGINTLYEDAQLLLSCLVARGGGEFLDSNRNNSDDFARLIRHSSQLTYSISKIVNVETLSEGVMLELLNRRIGDFSIIEGENIVLEPERRASYSSHELEPGVYKIELSTVPPLVSYFTVDREQELTITIIRSGQGLDLYDRAHLALGNQYYDNGQIEEALAEYQKVVEFDARNVDVHLNLGVIYDDIYMDREKAAVHYKTYLELQGPRQEEVREWLREVRGEPSEEEKLEEKRRQLEEEKARKEADRLVAEEAKRRERERQKALETHKEIGTANPDIVKLSAEEVISGDVVHITVSRNTTNSKAQQVAEDAARRMREQLGRTPEILVYRDGKPDVPIGRVEGSRSP